LNASESILGRANGRRQEPSELHKIAFGKEGTRKPKIKLNQIIATEAQKHLVARVTPEVLNSNLQGADEGVIKNLLTVVTNRAKVRIEMSNHIRLSTVGLQGLSEPNVRVGLPAWILRSWFFTEGKKAVLN
jgi:hypothetical protein